MLFHKSRLADRGAVRRPRGHEGESNQMNEDAMTWLMRHAGGLATTLVLALTFFQRFVRPAVGTAFEDAWLFVPCTALTHTLQVAIGFTFAESEEGSRKSAVNLIAQSFCGWAAFFYIVHTLHLGRFRDWAAAFALDSAIVASVVGAGSLTTWLAVATTVPRSATGRRLAAGPICSAHVLISAGGAVLLFVESITPVACYAVLLGGYGAALVGEALWSRRR